MQAGNFIQESGSINIIILSIV